MLYHFVGRSSSGSSTTAASARDITPPKPGPRWIWPARANRASGGRSSTTSPELDTVLLDDLDLARRHRPTDFLDWNLEGCRETLRELLAVLFSRGEDDVPLRAGGHGGNRSSHDLAVALDLDLADRESHGQIVEVVSFAADDEGPSRQELTRFRLFRNLLRQDPVGASARETGRPRLAVREGELASLSQGGFWGPRAVFDHGRRSAVDVGVRVAVAFFEMLLHELVVRPRIPTAEDQVAVRGERPTVCLEPHRLRRFDPRFLGRLDGLRLRGVHLLAGLRDGLFDPLCLQLCVFPAVVEGLRVRGHILVVVERDRIKIPDRHRHHVRLAVNRFDLAVLRRRSPFADCPEEFVEDRIVSIEADGLRLDEHRLFPQPLQRLPLLRDASLELCRDVVSDFHLRLRNRQEMGRRLIERRELPSIHLAVLPQFNRRHVDRSALLEYDGRPPFLVDRDRDVVQRRVQRIDLPVLEVLDSSLLVDARAQTQFLCVGASEIQYSREDPDHLALGALQGLREAVAVQVERVDARNRIRIPFADLDVAVLEFLREHHRDNHRIPDEDEIPSAENFEYDVESFGPSFDSEDCDSVQPSLLDRGQPRVIQQATERLCERRRRLWLVLDLVEAQPLTCLRIELDLAAVGDIDPKHDLVVPLINLVDVATEETLPFRDEDTEVERRDGGFHCARRCEDPCVT